MESEEYMNRKSRKQRGHVSILIIIIDINAAEEWDDTYFAVLLQQLLQAAILEFAFQ